jgi:hypothetical protein
MSVALSKGHSDTERAGGCGMSEASKRLASYMMLGASIPSLCDAVEEASGARCHKEAGHDGPHNGWAHYPGQLASWLTTPPPNLSTTEGDART